MVEMNEETISSFSKFNIKRINGTVSICTVIIAVRASEAQEIRIEIDRLISAHKVTVVHLKDGRSSDSLRFGLKIKIFT